MKPYYEHDGITIYQGDCLTVLPGLGPVDHVVTDPPYSEHVHSKRRRGGAEWPGQSGFIADYSRASDLGFDAIDAATRHLAASHLGQWVGRWVLVFTNAEGQSAWERDLVDAGLEHVRVGAWVKVNCTPQFTGDRPAQGFEAVEIAHPAGRKRWNGGGSPAVWHHPVAIDRSQDGSRFHPTQKPLTLMRELVTLFTDPGDLVLDPFMGSGTTLVAARLEGRRAIGIELEERWCEVAVRRLEHGDRGAAAISRGMTPLPWEVIS